MSLKMYLHLLQKYEESWAKLKDCYYVELDF